MTEHNTLSAALDAAIDSNLQPHTHPKYKMHDAVERMLQSKTNTLRLNEIEHGAFLKPIHEMAQTIGLKYKPAVFIVDHIPNAPAAYRKLPNAAGSPIGGFIMLNPGIMDALKCHPKRTPTMEMQGVIAHELSHVHYDLASMLISRLGPALAPLAAVGGLWLYDKAQKEKSFIEKTSNNALAAGDVTELNQHMSTLAEEEKCI